MGYDMYVIAPDPADVDAAKKLHEEFREEARRRDALPKGSPEAAEAQGHVTEAYRRMHAEDRTYFRLNMAGMSRCYERMHTLGMLCFPGQPDVEWPQPEQYGITDGEYEAHKYDNDAGLTAEQVTATRAYEDALNAHLAAHDGECPGIPDHKFGSNDGWLVTPPEITAALRLYMDNDEAKRREVAGGVEWWGQWIAWLDYARQHGGFEVN